ncbi:MAG TPA: SGNH/GDSL hydrolase family protein [Polyangiaceae bacterium]|nr:SGNH/GDSL hydrolase family protein [Polyangiaceae bacterium]
MKTIALLSLGVVLAGCASESGDVGETDSQLVTGPYVALGDSYSSGVGTREYYDDNCKRSNFAYAQLVAGAKGLDLQLEACSGAKIPDVKANQLSALTASTGLVTISIGGNDAGFSNVITKCAEPWPVNCSGDISNANAFIKNQLPGQLDSLYSQIRSLAPHARVIVVGYPRLFNGQQCNVLARISPQEQSDLNATADLLATTTSGIAKNHGFDFVDPRGPFTGHAVCDSVEWVNGLSDPITESYHPNRTGHQEYATLLEKLF